MTNGLYALASLDGSPIAERDRAALSLPATTSGCSAQGRDVDTAAIDTHDAAVFVGYLDTPDAIGTALGMDRRASPCALAVAALDRYGDAAPAHLPGEWSLLRWDAAARVLDLCQSAACRDPLYFACDGARVAVAPDIWRLAAVDWVGRPLDPRGLLMAMGRAPMRSQIAGETILRGVTQVQPGTRVRLAAGSIRAGAAQPQIVDTDPWRGSFADAIAELDALLFDIVHAKVERASSIAVLQSGGLDSSLVGVYAARALQPGQSLNFLTSAAVPGSGVEDETRYARMMADHLGVAMIPVIPAADADFYCPSARQLATMQGPGASPRHYVYDALERAASDCGATAMLDGAFGELTVTGYRSIVQRPTRLRGRIGAATRAVIAAWPRPHTPTDAFHVRLSPAAIDRVRAELDPQWRLPLAKIPDRPPGALCGIVPGAEKSGLGPTSTSDPALRSAFPFRDGRLMALFARMPTDFLTHANVDRAPGRALLSGHVPDAIRDRPKGTAFSPDYFIRARADAPAARTRVAAFAAAGLDEWIDLAWLDRSLAAIIAGDGRAMNVVMWIQSTAIAAEFLYRFDQRDARPAIMK